MKFLIKQTHSFICTVFSAFYFKRNNFIPFFDYIIHFISPLIPVIDIEIIFNTTIYKVSAYGRFGKATPFFGVVAKLCKRDVLTYPAI